jgi:hypothetical protein
MERGRVDRRVGQQLGQPARQHGRRDLGVELKAVGVLAVPEGVIGAARRAGQADRAGQRSWAGAKRS